MPSESLNLARLGQLLETSRLGHAPGWENELWDCLDSTNNRAAELLRAGAPEGVIVLSRQQTAGRGRQGKSWISPPDSGIYMSVVLRPDRDTTGLPLYTLGCGVACARALRESTGVKVGLKWVNDLIAGRRKVGGILAEIPSIASANADHATTPLVMGIGVNVRLYLQALPDDLRERVDCLERLSGEPLDANQIVASITKHLEQVLDDLRSGKQQETLDAWRLYSVTLGRQVRVISGNSEYTGLAVDIDQSGGLIMQTPTNDSLTVHAGEVSIRNADGTYA